MKKDKVYKFYSDSGHGWLAVKKQDLVDLGIFNQVTNYSYIKGNTVYLEEDCDASLFFKAFEIKFNIAPRYVSVFSNKDQSPIRSYERVKHG